MNEVYCPVLENEKMAADESPLGTACYIQLTPAFDDNGDKVLPTIIETEILDEDSDVDTTEGVYYNGVKGNQGDLMAFHNDSAGDNVMELNDDGELLISTRDDDSLKYSKDGLNLVYGE